MVGGGGWSDDVDEMICTKIVKNDTFRVGGCGAGVPGAVTAVEITKDEEFWVVVNDGLEFLQVNFVERWLVEGGDGILDVVSDLEVDGGVFKRSCVELESVVVEAVSDGYGGTAPTMRSPVGSMSGVVWDFEGVTGFQVGLLEKDDIWILCSYVVSKFEDFSLDTIGVP